MLLFAAFFLFLLFCLYIIVRWHILPLLTDFVQVDAQGLSCHVGESDFSIVWPDVVAANLHIGVSERYLELITDKGWHAVPLERFKHQEIWKAVQQYTPPAALAKEAIRRTTSYQQQQQADREWLPTVKLPLCASYPRFLTGAIGAMLICLSIAFLFWAKGNIIPALAITLLVTPLLGFGLISQNSKICLTEEGISYANFWRSDMMRWDEIRILKHKPGTGYLILQGATKQFEIPSPQYWMGRNQKESAEYFAAQLNLRHMGLEGDTITI